MASTELPLGPGKLVPRLLRDLLDYDPRRKRPDAKNLLADPAPIFKENEDFVSRRMETDCQHNLYRKDQQSHIPRADASPSAGEFYRSASYCSKCYYHFDVDLDLSSRSDRQQVCNLSSIFPMHHLVRTDSRFRTPEELRMSGERFDPWIQQHIWLCSAPGCPAVVTVRITLPRLDKEKKALLADKKVLYERGAAVIKLNPERYPAPQAPLSPGDALWILRQYLTDARTSYDKRVAARNKRFLLAFAEDCDDILKWMGFQEAHDLAIEGEAEAMDKFWALPRVADVQEQWRGKTNRNLIDDIYLEISQILSNLPERDRSSKTFQYLPLNAIRDLHSIFGITNYIRNHRVVNLEATEHPYYSSIGATEDLPDELVQFAYERQRDCDPSKTPYYFECLGNIARGRNSETLMTEVAMADSMGQETQSKIDEAYEYFGVRPDATDDHVIGIYTSRIESAPRQADEAKACLLTIGRARASDKIMEIATSHAMSFQDALLFMGIAENPDADVETINAAATMLQFEGSKDKVVRAVKAIADHRQHDFALNLLVTELETGKKAEGMSLKSAYDRLQIADPNVPDESVLFYYKSLSDDAPAGSKQSFLEALNTIAVDRQSQQLLAQVSNPGSQIQAPKGQPDQPVGLANIGNTCYLNSLLQFYYTVNAVREVVMNFEHYKMDITEQTLARKRVGGRAVRKQEILRAQEFIPLLAGLYTQLKVASSRSVRPTQDLAEMTLYSQEADEQFRRASMSGIEPNAMSIAAVMNESFIGPSLPPPPPPPNRPPPVPIDLTDTFEDIEMIDPSKPETDMDDTASDTTLVDMDDAAPNGSAVNISDVEMSDIRSEMQEASTGASQLMTGMNVKEPLISVEELSDEEAIEIDPDENDDRPQPSNSIIARQQTPDKPAVPPRTKPTPIDTSGRNNKKMKLEFGAQQDVTEVIGNLMFNLECAIKPTDIDAESGEQIDIIRDTFFGSTAVYLKKKETYARKVEPWANLIVFPDIGSSRTIYEALDVAFDEQTVEIDNASTTQYASISKLPPVLQIQIQRTQYDPIRREASKNQNRIEFDETIFLDRYMDNEKVLQRRKESGQRKAQLAELNLRAKSIEETEDNLSSIEALGATQEFLRGIQEEDLAIFPDDLAEALSERSSFLAEQLKEIDLERQILKARIREDFTDMREHRYSLQAVFMHKGGSGSGHHWVYIYDFKADVWREYNDERVEIIRDRKKVFEHVGYSENDTRPATAHYLVYVRDDQKFDLVDAVCRAMEEPLPEMLDVSENPPLSIRATISNEDSDTEVMHVEDCQEMVQKPGSNENWGEAGNAAGWNADQSSSEAQSDWNKPL